MNGYHYLMRLAHLFNTLVRFAGHLFRDLGVREAIAFMRPSCAAPGSTPSACAACSLCPYTSNSSNLARTQRRPRARRPSRARAAFGGRPPRTRRSVPKVLLGAIQRSYRNCRSCPRRPRGPEPFGSPDEAGGRVMLQGCAGGCGVGGTSSASVSCGAFGSCRCDRTGLRWAVRDPRLHRVRACGPCAGVVGASCHRRLRP